MLRPNGRKILADGVSRGKFVDPIRSPGTGRKLMPHSLASVRAHVIFSSKNRVPGHSDDVHLLVSLPATESVAELLRVVKTNSSRWSTISFPRKDDSPGRLVTPPYCEDLSLRGCEGVHRAAAGASPPSVVPRGVSGIPAETRHRIGQPRPMGLRQLFRPVPGLCLTSPRGPTAYAVGYCL